MKDRSEIGLALGGGGVRGLAHISYLEVLDEFGIRPAMVAGTSMGAIIGALYASGKTGKEIRGIIEDHMITGEDGLKEIFEKRGSLVKWLKAVRLSWNGTGLFRADGLVHDLIDEIKAETFEELKIPLHVVATNFYTGEMVVFKEGELLRAINASMSIPGVFVPVEFADMILVDGGMVNNLPYNLLKDRCDLTIAIDVTPKRIRDDAEPPSMLDATLGMFDILIGRITAQMMEDDPPDIYANPGLTGIRMLEFDRAEEVLETADAAKADFKEQIKAIRKLDK